MQKNTHPLISPALGTARALTSFHYGPGGGQKVYVQSSLHADELPGMLVAWELRRKLAALEAAGQLRAEIVVVPVTVLIRWPVMLVRLEAFVSVTVTSEPAPDGESSSTTTMHVFG